MKKLFPLLLLLLLTSCGATHRAPVVSGDTLKLRHASLLSIVRTDSFTVVDVKSPWKANALLHRYILVSRTAPMPRHLPEGTLLRTPLRRAVAFSSVHCGLLLQLGKLNHICGVCDVPFVLLPAVKEAVKQGSIKDMGSSMSPDVERLTAARPDALLVSPFENGGYGALEKTGIPLVECADYLETSALGRAEWMRFFGLLFDCSQQTDTLFSGVEAHYLQLKEQALATSARPGVLFDKKDGNVWFVPGEKSTLGQLVADAGGRYLFGNNGKNGSVSLNFETVFSQAAQADVWLIKYGYSQDITYRSLSADYPSYARFKAFGSRRIYGCNTFSVPFFDEEPFHPDWLLADFIKILHPEILPHYALCYYAPLKP